MRLIEEVDVNLELIDLKHRQVLVRPAQPESRLAGIHLSGVLRYVINSSRMPGWQTYAKELDAGSLPLIWFLGIAWEEACASLYPECVWQPGPTIWEQVSMTCDGLSMLPEGMCVEEFKYTSCKRKTGVEFQNDWLKMQQGRGYAGGYGARLIRWHVLWNNAPWAPAYVRYLFEVTEEDVEATRTLIASNRDGAIAAGYGEE